MYEIIIDGSMNVNKNIENVTLRDATNLIAYAMNAGKQAVMCVAETLSWVAENEYYLLGGFKSMAQYASTMFNMSDTTCRKYVRIGKMITQKTVTDENGNEKQIYTTVFARGENDFSVGHLLEIESKIKKVSTVNSLIENGVLSFNMSTKKVREICSDYKDGKIDIKGNRLIETTAEIKDVQTGDTAEKKQTADTAEDRQTADTAKKITVTPKDSNNSENISPIEILQYLKKYCNMYHELTLKDKEVDKAVQNLLKAINK